MTKTRIGERLSKATDQYAVSAKDNKTNSVRSHELEKLLEDYSTFVKRFKPLVSSIKEHHSQLLKLEKSQAQVLEELNQWAYKTPIAAVENNPIKVFQKELLKTDQAFSSRFKNDLMEYVHEWELVVKTRVTASEKQVKELRSNLDHYTKKVQSLQRHQEGLKDKGKTPEEKDVEKLRRNEEKLALAKDSYEANATFLCHLLDEIMNCAWKDLLPFLVKMTKMENEYANEKKAVLDAHAMVDNLKSLADEYDIDLTTPPPTKPAEKGGTVSKKVAPAKEQ